MPPYTSKHCHMNKSRLEIERQFILNLVRFLFLGSAGLGLNGQRAPQTDAGMDGQSQASQRTTAFELWKGRPQGNAMFSNHFWKAIFRNCPKTCHSAAESFNWQGKKSCRRRPKIKYPLLHPQIMSPLVFISWVEDASRIMAMVC